MFEKLKFWKHKGDDLGLNKSEFGKVDDIKLPEFGKTDFNSSLDVPPDEFGKLNETTYGRAPFPEHEMATLKESAPNMPKFQQQPQWQGYQTTNEMQVISAKLDALKASLDSINQRLENLERIAQGEQPRRWQYR